LKPTKATEPVREGTEVLRGLMVWLRRSLSLITGMLALKTSYRDEDDVNYG
jgi:hypothetical protein